MFEFELNNTIAVAQQKAIEEAIANNPKVINLVRKIIRRHLIEARAKTVRGIHFKHGDPRDAVRAIRIAVYRRVLGGNLNIFNSPKAHGKTNYTPKRTLKPGNRGGNRRSRSSDTVRYMSYAGPDRGFILRFVNSGTSDRKVRFTHSDSRKKDKWNNNPNSGNRGKITPANFFEPAADRALAQMSEELAASLSEELTELMNSKKR